MSSDQIPNLPAPELLAVRKYVGAAARLMSAHVCTSPVLQTAAELLLALTETAAGCGIDMTGYKGVEWSHRLATTALDMAESQIPKPAVSTPEDAGALLDLVAERLQSGGIDARRRGWEGVVLPRSEHTPRWGADGQERLVISLTIDRGWVLLKDNPRGSTVVTVVGACNESGIDAMLGVAVDVNEGVRGDVFRRL